MSRRAPAVIFIVLVLLGVVAGGARTAFPASLGQHLEQLRIRMWHVAGVNEPNATERGLQVRQLETRFGANQLLIASHAALGALFLVLGSLQFNRRIRARHIRLHRWNGRLLVTCSVILTLTGVYFGVLIPVAGLPEAVVITVVAVLFVVALTKGVLAIRKGDAAKHREWMIRAFGVAVGISVVRIVALFADALLTPRGWLLADVFVLSLILGWGISIMSAELWIIFTREVHRSLPHGAVHSLFRNGEH